MASTRQTARKRLDQRLVGLDLGQGPPRGWIRAIRDALGMSTSELGRRMGLTQSRVSQIERAEEFGSIRLDTLDRAARALNCQVRYVFVPNEPLEKMVRHQAHLRAEAEIEAVTHTMALEGQTPEPDVIRAQVEELAERLIDSPRLWTEIKARARQ